MPVDHIRYDILAQQALRGVVRTVLADAAKKGLPGEHHFKITFATAAPGVRLSDRMRAQYPEAMTIVLQHQFWDLAVGDEAFEVGLSFGGIAERLAVPFDAITAFFDPAVQFGFQFETIEGRGGAAAEGRRHAWRGGRAKSAQGRRESPPCQRHDQTRGAAVARRVRDSPKTPAPEQRRAAAPKSCASTGFGRSKDVLRVMFVIRSFPRKAGIQFSGSPLARGRADS